MDRRTFLRSAFAVAGGAAAAVMLSPREAAAKSLMDELREHEGRGAAPGTAGSDADIPAPGAQEVQQWRWRRDRGWNRPYRRRGGGPGWRGRGRGWGRRCWWRVNRWGRHVRVCAW